MPAFLFVAERQVFICVYLEQYYGSLSKLLELWPKRLLETSLHLVDQGILI